MIFRYLIWFLGLNSWEINIPWYLDLFIKKRKVSDTVKIIIKTETSLVNYSPSPINNIYEEKNYEDYRNPGKWDYVKILLYSMWSIFILSLLSLQPIYTFVNAINGENTYDNIVLTVLYIIVPYHYVWAKYYFSRNHFDKFFLESHWRCNDYCTILSIICILVSMVSVIPYVYNKNQLDYYWTKNTPFFIPLFICCEIVGRLVILINSGVFILTFSKHLITLRRNIKAIEDAIDVKFNSYTTMSELLVKFCELKSELAWSKYYYNNLVSVSTTCGLFGTILFVHHKHVTENFKFTSTDNFILIIIVYYIISQSLFMSILIAYSMKRDSLNKYVNSINFVSRYLSRTKIKRDKTRTQMEKNVVIIQEESATTLDWMLLDKITKENWIDFTILGISTRDGSLIKRSVAFATLFYTLLRFF